MPFRVIQTGTPVTSFQDADTEPFRRAGMGILGAIGDYAKRQQDQALADRQFGLQQQEADRRAKMFDAEQAHRDQTLAIEKDRVNRGLWMDQKRFEAEQAHREQTLAIEKDRVNRDQAQAENIQKGITTSGRAAPTAGGKSPEDPDKKDDMAELRRLSEHTDTLRMTAADPMKQGPQNPEISRQIKRNEDRMRAILSDRVAAMYAANATREEVDALLIRILGAEKFQQMKQEADAQAAQEEAARKQPIKNGIAGAKNADALAQIANEDAKAADKLVGDMVVQGESVADILAKVARTYGDAEMRRQQARIQEAGYNPAPKPPGSKLTPEMVPRVEVDPTAGRLPF